MYPKQLLFEVCWNDFSLINFQHMLLKTTHVAFFRKKLDKNIHSPQFTDSQPILLHRTIKH